MLKIAAPRSLAAVPLLLLAGAHETAYEILFFTDHADAVRGLHDRRFDLLCTGFTELDRSHLFCTFVWGLSALVVRDSSVRTVADLLRYCDNNPGAELVLPFLGSPLDLHVRALFRSLQPQANIRFSNQPLGETLKQFLAGNVFAAVLPEPMVSTLELAGKASRLTDLAALHAQVSGDARSPQVALFAEKGKILPDDFPPEFAQSIRMAGAMTAEQQCAAAKALGITEAVLAHAMAHVLFELPGQAESANLENRFVELVALKPES